MDTNRERARERERDREREREGERKRERDPTPSMSSIKAGGVLGKQKNHRTTKVKISRYFAGNAPEVVDQVVDETTEKGRRERERKKERGGDIQLTPGRG